MNKWLLLPCTLVTCSWQRYNIIAIQHDYSLLLLYRMITLYYCYTTWLLSIIAIPHDYSLLLLYNIVTIYLLLYHMITLFYCYTTWLLSIIALQYRYYLSIVPWLCIPLSLYHCLTLPVYHCFSLSLCVRVSLLV